MILSTFHIISLSNLSDKWQNKARIFAFRHSRLNFYFSLETKCFLFLVYRYLLACGIWLVEWRNPRIWLVEIFFIYFRFIINISKTYFWYSILIVNRYLFRNLVIKIDRFGSVRFGKIHFSLVTLSYLYSFMQKY
jgi:hypothetical protein